MQAQHSAPERFIAEGVEPKDLLTIRDLVLRVVEDVECSLHT
jgi:hypothetical protein